MSILDHWPIESPPRDGQVDCLTQLEKHKDAKYLIVQAPVGSGKSLIGLTFARFMSQGDGNSYILTPQRILQEQYATTFANRNVVPLYGKGTYTCDKHNSSCEVGAMLTPKDIACKDSCPWKQQRSAAKAAANSVFNYKLALLHFDLAEPVFAPRKLIVCDEAHQLEEQLINHDCISITRDDARAFKATWPDIRNTDLSSAHQWAIDEYLEPLRDRVADLKEDAERIKNSNSPSKREVRTLKDYDRLKKHLDEVESICLNDIDQLLKTHVLVCNYTEIQFKRLYARHSFARVLNRHAEQFLFMSSTIFDKEKFCDDLGINPDEAVYIEVDSEFETDNRPVFYLPQMKMNASWNKPENRVGRNNLLNTMQTLVSEYHDNESGIIHTANFKIAEWLVDNLKIPTHTIFHHNPNDEHTRDEAINGYLEQSKYEPCILISPSITEGLDLKNELGRFAIIAKTPFGFLGDQWIKRRMELSNEWYQRRALISVIQGCGRVVRSKEDYGSVYILDESWRYLYNQMWNRIPQWWKDGYQELN